MQKLQALRSHATRPLRGRGGSRAPLCACQQPTGSAAAQHSMAASVLQQPVGTDLELGQALPGLLIQHGHIAAFIPLLRRAQARATQLVLLHAQPTLHSRTRPPFGARAPCCWIWCARARVCVRVCVRACVCVCVCVCV